MATRANDAVRFGSRFIAAAIVALAALAIASPASAAKKPPPEPEAVVSQFLAALDAEAAKAETNAEKIRVEVTKRLDRAVTRLNLGEVLKADQTTARGVERSSRAFEKYAIRGQTKVLKDLDRLTSNPEHALTVRTAVAQAVADVQSAHNALRTDVADMVNEAIDGIQEILDDLLAEDVGAGE